MKFWSSFKKMFSPLANAGLVENARAASVAGEAVAEPRQQKRSSESFNLRSEAAFRVFGVHGGNGVTNDDLLSVPPMFSAIRYISEGIAMLDRQVLRKRAEGGSETALGHVMWEFFNIAPNPYVTWFDLLSAWVSNACLGNGYLWVRRDSRCRPEVLHNLPQSCVSIEFVSGSLWYYVSGEIDGEMVSERVPYTDILHLKGFSLTGVAGRPVRLIHRSILSSMKAGQEYTENIFANQARPSLAIKYDQPLDDIERQNVKMNLMSDLSGAAIGSPLVLDDGMDLQYLQWSPNDVAFSDFHRMSMENASMITKVPMDLLFSNNTGTYGAAVQRNQNFLSHCLGPWQEKIQEVINRGLFWEKEYRTKSVWFRFDSAPLLKLDIESEARVAGNLVASSLITPNEARARLGLNPMLGGDTLYGNINTLPLDQVTQVALAKYLSSAGEQRFPVEDAPVEKQPAPDLSQDNNNIDANLG